ncbi:MAG: hypothetical protein CMH54_14710 [Myxococcales bacterium]|nr:hypothetical protein [Myxococcales bacterium]
MKCWSCQKEIASDQFYCGYCGAQARPPEEEESNIETSTRETSLSKISLEEESSYVGQIIDRRYQVLDLVARGGMGSVYRVVHIHMRKVLALKLLHEHMLAKQKNVTRFLREARAVSRLSSKHTVRVYDFGKYREVFYLVMEYLDGKDLYDVLEENGPLGVSRVVSILDQICSSLQEAHAAGIIHRDLKSENLMILQDDDGRDFVKVLDFGLAKVLDPSEPITAQSQQDLFGTPYYMAPEQIRGRNVDPRTDIYALGALTFRMLTGTFPFSAETAFDTLRAHLTEPIPAAREVAPELGIPKWLDDIIERCLRKDPDERFPDMHALRAALRTGPGTEFLGLEPLVGSGPTDTVPKNGDEGLSSAGAGLKRLAKSGGISRFFRFFKDFRIRVRILGVLGALAVALSIGITAYIWATGTVHVKGLEAEPNNTMTQANILTDTLNVIGHMNTRRSNKESDADFFRVEIAEKRRLSSRVSGTRGMNMNIWILDAQGQEIAKIQREGIGLGEQMSCIPVEPPHFFVKVFAELKGTDDEPKENPKEAYTLGLKLDKPGSCAETEPNDDQQGQIQNILRFDRVTRAVLDTNNDVDLYRVALLDRDAAGLELDFSSEGHRPLMVRLLDPKGEARFEHAFTSSSSGARVQVAGAGKRLSGRILEVSVPEIIRTGDQADDQEKHLYRTDYALIVRELKDNMLHEMEPQNNVARSAQWLAYNARFRGHLHSHDPIDYYRFLTSTNDREDRSRLSISSRGPVAPKVTISYNNDKGQALTFRRKRVSGKVTWEKTIDIRQTGEEAVIKLDSSHTSKALSYVIRLQPFSKAKGDFYDPRH